MPFRGGCRHQRLSGRAAPQRLIVHNTRCLRLCSSSREHNPQSLSWRQAAVSAETALISTYLSYLKHYCLRVGSESFWVLTSVGRVAAMLAMS